MNKTFLEAIRIIFAVIAIILMILTIIMLIIKILGHSPNEATIMFSALGIFATLLTIIISVLFQIKGDVGELKEFKRQTIDKIKELERKTTKK